MASPEADAPSAPEHNVRPDVSDTDLSSLSDGEVSDDAVEEMEDDDLYTDEPQGSSAAGDASDMSDAPDTQIPAEAEVEVEVEVDEAEAIEAEDDASSSEIHDNVNANTDAAVDADALNTAPTSPPAQPAAQNHTQSSADASTEAQADADAEHAANVPVANVPAPSTGGAVDGSVNTDSMGDNDLFAEDVGGTAADSAASLVDPKSDADDEEEEEGEAKEDDDEDTGAQQPASASPPLPYIADIAMLDTGEPGEGQPDAPAVSAFSSMLGAAASSPRPGGEDIDVDKLFEAITASPKQKQRQPPTGPSAMSSKPPKAPKAPKLPKVPKAPKAPKATKAAKVTKPSKPSKPIPTGPAHPHALPKPPTGPARTSGGATSSMAAHASSPKPNTAHGGAIPRGPAAAGRQSNSHRDKASVERAYQAFLVEEKAYTAVGNWETNFPEGSRMFIGNLSQERVSKRDVFDKFHHYGRLAQVAIKSAYGFVQYHTADEARAAIKNLEGVDIRGRQIHLEITKRKGNERDHDASPDRAKSRGGRGHDRHDTTRDQQSGNGRRSRGERRDASPRRDHGRGGDDHYSSRDRSDRDRKGRHARDRSRSPGRHGHDKSSLSYRSRRSPSPRDRDQNKRNDRSSSTKYEDIKMRSGSDVPDVQFLVNPGLEREFVKWAQAPFQERGLRTDVLFRSPLTPPRDTLIQTHIVEGVVAVVDLNMAAQVAGKIPMQVFDRSAGASRVRFDGYQDLAPSVAADVAVRAKTTSVAQRRHAAQQPYQPPAPYGGGYAPRAPASVPSAPAISTSDLVALSTQLDATTFGQVVAMLQSPQQQQPQQQQPAASVYGQQQSPTQYGVPQQPPQQPQQPPQQQQQLDLASVLSLLGSATPANSYGTAHPAAPAAYGQGGGYPGAPTTAAPSAYQQASGQAASDQALQAIMAQLGQFRQ